MTQNCVVQPDTGIYEEEKNELHPPPQKKLRGKRFDEVDRFLSV
jgi:hypothetical protein